MVDDRTRRCPDGDGPERVLVADIGGTNSRFALADLDGGRPVLHDMRRLPAESFASLLQAARHYLEQIQAAPRRAAIAVACPVAGDDIRLTNRAWSFNREELRQALDLDELLIMNDFGAAARAVPELLVDEREDLYGSGDAGAALTAGPVSVLGPGTGLGMALLAPPVNGRSTWQVIETEGGHVSYAPQGSEERAVHEWLAARHGRVSIERVLSGRGLSAIHAALSDSAPSKQDTPDSILRNPEEIVTAAIDGDDAIARRALARFCAILGSFSGDAALIHGARTVAIAGGIVPRFIPFLRTSAFRERFLDKGRFAAYLESVQVTVVTHDEPGLLGVALALSAHQQRGRGIAGLHT